MKKILFPIGIIIGYAGWFFPLAIIFVRLIEGELTFSKFLLLLLISYLSGALAGFLQYHEEDDPNNKEGESESSLIAGLSIILCFYTFSKFVQLITLGKINLRKRN